MLVAQNSLGPVCPVPLTVRGTDETDSESDEYVPSLEESEDIFAPRAPAPYR